MSLHNLVVFLFSLGLLLATGEVRASTSSCAGATDGTPCTTSCYSGTCETNLCVVVTLRPDGTPCSTENLCTSDDACHAGTCVSGPHVMCPSLSACLVGDCNPHEGCYTRNICPPDLAGLDLAGSDLAPADGGSVADLTTSSTDGGPAQDQSLIPPNDMCFIPPGSEFFECNGADGMYTLPLDAALPPLGSFHVRGSRIGDCSFGGSGAEPLGLALLLCAFLAAAALTRRTS